MKSILTLLLLILVSGCATLPTPVPCPRVDAYYVVTTETGETKLTMVDKGFFDDPENWATLEELNRMREQYFIENDMMGRE